MKKHQEISARLNNPQLPSISLTPFIKNLRGSYKRPAPNDQQMSLKQSLNSLRPSFEKLQVD